MLCSAVSARCSQAALYLTKAARTATRVNSSAEIWPTRSEKLSNPTARPPSSTEKLSQDRNVRSLAKKTLGSRRGGSAMRLPMRRGACQIENITRGMDGA